MATIGQSITTPEAGWKRYDDTEKNISYEGSWTSATSIIDADYNNSIHYALGAGTAKFNFVGTKLRVLDGLNPNRSNQIKITIDGISEVFSENAAQLLQAIAYEKLGLPSGEHVVVIENMASGYIGIDAIDIDDTGELKPYNPQVSVTPQTSGNILLRVTMIDSSEREYKVSSTEVDGFVNWYNHHASTDAASYAINDAVDGSKEYLVFEKIISFKVIPLAQ